MAKKFKVLAVVMAALLVFCVFVAGLPELKDFNTAVPDDNYKTELLSIYSSFNPDLSKIDKNDEFALKRLIVSDYEGNDYGAVSSAVDEKNNFAVLQYDTREQAESAYNKIKKDGLTVNTDGVAEIASFEKGEMYPAGSNAVGSKSFIDKYAMDAEDVVVAVIDTGVMLNHPDLAGRFVSEGYDYTSDRFDNADYDKELQPGYYHGSSVCGIIANNTKDNVKILPYKVFPFGSRYSTDSAIISSINNAVDMGVDVINMSLSSDSSASAYKKAVDNATSKNICVCVSAGNSSKDCSKTYPASIGSAFTVSALNITMSDIASFSNYGPSVDFCAPGTKINSAIPLPGGEGGYDLCSGTSFSTPYVTALCSNIKSIDTNLSNDDVYKVLCDFCTDYGDEGFDEYYGYGLPNIGNINYSEDGYYSYSIPQGVLKISDSVDCTEDTQPWGVFASKIKKVIIDESAGSIGAYSFSNMEKAEFEINSKLISVGEYAFKNCTNLKNITFDKDVEYIGTGAFEDIDDFTITGYTNTPAYEYALLNNITFNSLGCKHSYVMDVVEPSGEDDGYTIYKCRACGDSYIGEYIKSEIISAGICGNDLSYSLYNTGKLIIFGTGEMYDYSSVSAPWSEYASSVSIVEIEQGVTGVCPFSFYGFSNLAEFKSNSSSFSVMNKSLYSADGTKLISAVCDLGNIYSMPGSVTDFDATAFLSMKTVVVSPNENFTSSSSIIYDRDGNIVMALPSYRTALLSLDSDIDIYDYAFLLTKYPISVRVYSTQTRFGEYSIGYYYNNGFEKNDLVYYGYIDAPAYEYAVKNGFTTNLLNGGSCGDDLTWYYNIAKKTLTISGTGDMTRYSNKMLVPWYDYMDSIEKVVIEEDVRSVSVYAFYGAAALKELTLPASISAPTSINVWYGCENIETINLTTGSGQMADYGTSNSAKTYTYTPWYISRNSITDFNLSPDITRIGSYAFRGCGGIRSITLNSCSIISKYAFYDCSNLDSVVIYAKDTSFGSNALFSYSSKDLVNTDAKIIAYSDSTAKDYAKDNSINFVSLGCGHSRTVTAVSDHPSCCYDTNVQYYCSDCNSHLYDEYLTATSSGHFVKGTVITTRGKVITDAEVYLDGVLSAITNEYGKFVVDDVMCDIEHMVEIKKHNTTIASVTVNTDSSNRNGTLVIKYGNFIKDTAVNGKDYVYAKHRGFDDLDLIDFGKIQGEKLAIGTKYQIQNTPSVSNMYIEQNASVSYRRDFYFDVSHTSDYSVCEVGIIYGKNMDDDFMCLENVGKKNSQGLALKSSVVNDYVKTYFLSYGSSGSDGKISARLYLKYTNGVKTYTYYSDVLSYTY